MGCSTVAVSSPRNNTGGFFKSPVLPANQHIMKVAGPGFEPGTP
jgi:hypothetical protein